MRKQKNIEIKVIFAAVSLLFFLFLIMPMLKILAESCTGKSGLTLQYYRDIFARRDFLGIFLRSIGIAMASAILTTFFAFLLAYSIHFTNLSGSYKRIIRKLAVLPMLLPTITYGFAIIYSCGKQGLFTRIFGRQLFDIYGVNGLLIGYVIYTLPVSFMLLNNTMNYIDKKYLVVSRVMGDSHIRTFLKTVLRPLSGTMAASVIQCFFLCFTDFGIPASVGGRKEVIAGVLYNEMLGSVPNFHSGAVVALFMLLPSVLSIAVLNYLERYNIRYNRISQVELRKSAFRDVLFGMVSAVILLSVLAVFAVIFLVPFIEEWPYRMQITMEHIKAVFTDRGLTQVVKNSILTALLTALIGTVVSYGAALVTARSSISARCKKLIEGIALVTNTIPGMVLGIAFLLTFTGTKLQNTTAILIFCNLIHFFSTPYLMMKSSLEKMNASWETTARLMGDSWFQTIVRVVTPNAVSTLAEVFGYYFVNAMVTVSAVIFISGARTMVITAKIKELQHYAKFNEIFVLSLLILIINIAAKSVIEIWGKVKKEELRDEKGI